MRTLKSSSAPQKTVSRPSEREEAVDMGTLIAYMLHGATGTHFAHLKTTSFAAHCALGEFYEVMPGLADGVAEQYQGLTEQLLEFPEVTLPVIKTPDEALNFLRELYEIVQEYQDRCMFSEIISELDVIKSQIGKTKYKLIFLK